VKIKRIKQLKIGCHTFAVTWDKSHIGASFCYDKMEIIIGVKDSSPNYLLNLISHELMEICACEMHVRYYRPDIQDDYLFSYDHRQHTTMISMFSGLLGEFLL